MTTPTREQSLQWAREAGVMIGTDEEWSVPVSLYIRDRLYVLAALAYSAGAAPWREAVWEARAGAGLDGFGDDADPRTVLKEAIDWRVQIALDPAVSSAAQALIDRGAASMRDCRTCMNRDEGINHCSTTAQCINASQYTPRIPLTMWDNVGAERAPTAETK